MARNLTLPAKAESSAVRKVLKTKWLDEADFTRSYDHSNIVLMRLELVVEELTEVDLDRLLDLPTKGLVRQRPVGRYAAVLGVCSEKASGHDFTEGEGLAHEGAVLTSALRAAVPVATADASAYNFLAITDNQMQERM